MFYAEIFRHAQRETLQSPVGGFSRRVAAPSHPPANVPAQLAGVWEAAAWPGSMLLSPRTQTLSPICDSSVTGFSRKIGTDPIAHRQVTDLSCAAVAGRPGDK